MQSRLENRKVSPDRAANRSSTSGRNRKLKYGQYDILVVFAKHVKEMKEDLSLLRSNQNENQRGKQKHCSMTVKD